MTNKYRADVSEVQADGATVWRTEWLGGPSLARVDDCRLVTLSGDMRAKVYVTGEADTVFSIPALCRIKGARVTGYLTNEDGNLVFHHCYY
jgi:hypothetical protein